MNKIVKTHISFHINKYTPIITPSIKNSYLVTFPIRKKSLFFFPKTFYEDDFFPLLTLISKILSVIFVKIQVYNWCIIIILLVQQPFFFYTFDNIFLYKFFCVFYILLGGCPSIIFIINYIFGTINSPNNAFISICFYINCIITLG